MRRIWLWGVGKYLEKVKDVVVDEKKVAGIIDNSAELQGKVVFEIPVYNPKDIEISREDVIVITSFRKYNEIRKEAGALYDIPKENILCFFDSGSNVKEFADDIDPFRWSAINEIIGLERKSDANKGKIECLEYKSDYLEKRIELFTRDINGLLNLRYEIPDIVYKKRIEYPRIGSKEETLYKIIVEKKSMCRFGDGEMELIFGRNRPAFQIPDKKLGERLKEVMESSDERILICIADNYGLLDEFSDDAARNIRLYLTEERRREQKQLLDMNRKYYDAYVSRPYILYRDKESAAGLFALWKRVWEDRDILLVEGSATRNGYGNDLFQNAKSIRRLLAPNENAWTCYAQIRHYILEHVDKDFLVLISLGPAATVMAYDLTHDGYQAIDIGHLDNEYEWFLKNCTERVDISYKYVSEVPQGDVVDDIHDTDYEAQVLIKIGC